MKITNIFDYQLFKKELLYNKKFQRKFYLGLSGAILGVFVSYHYLSKIPYRIGLIDSPSIYRKIAIYKIINPNNLYTNMNKFYTRNNIYFDIIEKNKLYVFGLPKDTKYYKKDTEFIKYAKCLAGDKLEVKGYDYYCNNHKFATARKTDSKGIPVKHFVFNGVIPQGKIFMYAPHPHSYDSRYWGFADIKNIKGKVVWDF